MLDPGGGGECLLHPRIFPAHGPSASVTEVSSPPPHNGSAGQPAYGRKLRVSKLAALDMFHFQFMNPLSSFSVGYKSESNDANDSKKEDLSQLFGI